MKYLFTNKQTKESILLKENYEELSFERLMNLCKNHNITTYHGYGIGHTPSAELTNKNDYSYTINLIFEDIEEASCAEELLKGLTKKQYNLIGTKTSTKGITVSYNLVRLIDHHKKPKESYNSCLWRLIGAKLYDSEF